MTDVSWGNDHLEPPKRRSITPWIIGCLGCGMFFIGAVAVAGFLFGPKLKQAVTERLERLARPEVQWPQLAQWLPFEEQPADFEIVKWPLLDMWQLEAVADDLVVFVLAWPEKGGGASPGQMLTNPDTSPLIHLMKADFEAVETTVTLQGRELFGARLERKEEPEDGPESEPEPQRRRGGDPSGRGAAEAFMHVETIQGNGLGLDVTPEGSDQRVLVWIFRRKRDGTVTDEDARLALSHFLIGPDRR